MGRHSAAMDIHLTRLLIALLALPSATARAAEAPIEPEASGPTPSLEYLIEYRANLGGGLARGGAWLDQLTLALDDGERWHASVLATNNNTFSDRFSGDLQVVSNIDAGHTLRVFEAWYQWPVGNTRLLAGLYDLNSEFDAIETAGLFNQSSHGIGPDISQSGERGPSIFPHASFALRLDGGNDTLRWRVAALDALPGDRQHEARTAIHLSAKEGALLIAELERPGATRLVTGAWGYTRRFMQLDGSGRAAQYGAYAFADKTLAERNGWQWSGFARIGWTGQSALAIRRYAGLGVVASHDDGRQWGLALASAHLGHAGRALIAAEDGDPSQGELAMELTANWPLRRWLAVQPGLTWVRHPGARRDVKSVTIASLRWAFTW